MYKTSNLWRIVGSYLITPRKEKMTVAQLKEQENLPLEHALNSLQTNVFYADADFKLIYLNDRALETLESIKDEIEATYGFSVDSLLGRNIDDFHKNPSHQRKILNNNKNFPINTEIKIGSLILDLNVNRVSDDKGKTQGFVVNWEEISAKKEAEEEAGRLANMVKLSPINTMMSDKEGNLLYMNDNSMKTLKTLEHLLPAKVDQLVGNKIDWFHKNPAHQQKIISNPSNLPHSAVIQLGDEKLDLLVSPIYDHAGEYVGPMVTWDVITQKEKLIADLTESSQQLSSAAEELLSVSETMSANAEETTAQSNTASAASEEVSAGIQTVATNMEEMTASIREITKNTNEASNKSADATNLSNEANKIIDQLGESSLAIGNIIKVITSIAQQTNLLALNATIEAARAGEAGKGFAVVANEVKELAKQTATATEDISRKIEAIQNDSQVAVTSIGSVTEAIQQLNSIAGNIASAMEEQSATTNEVARVVTESTTGVQQITENIQQVSTAAEQTGKATNDMRGAAEDLNKLARRLGDLVEQVTNS